MDQNWIHRIQFLISAPTAVDLPGNPAGTASCYSVKNLSSNGYFVPWNTPKEWSAFLGAIGAADQLHILLGLPIPTNPPPVTPWLENQIAISSCCAPQTVGTVCTTTNSTITSNAQLGDRYVGTPSGDTPNWGASGDIYYVDASQISGNSTIDYSVTWTCKAGSWIQNA